MIAAAVINAAGGWGDDHRPAMPWDFFPHLEPEPDPNADAHALIGALKARGARDMRGQRGGT